MNEEKEITRYVWPVIVILALVLIGMALFEMSMIESTMESALEMSGSSVTVESLDEGAVACFSMFVGGTFMHGIWFGIFGLFCAWGVKRKEGFAWKLGVLWGVLLIAYGIIVAVNELFVLGWSTVCATVLECIIIGVIVLGCLLVVRKEFS